MNWVPTFSVIANKVWLKRQIDKLLDTSSSEWAYEKFFVNVYKALLSTEWSYVKSDKSPEQI